MKRTCFGLIVVVIAFSLVLIGGGSKKEAVEEGEELIEVVVGVINEHMSMDQFTDNVDPNHSIKQLMYNGLLEYTQDGELIPGLAESWEISDDVTEFTFHLRKGVKFHNGREFVANDVKQSLEWAKDPNSGCFFGSLYEPIDEIKIIDDYTIRMKISDPNIAFLHSLASGKRPIVAMEQYNEDNSIDVPIGTGPYKFVEWVRDDHLTFAKFDEFWGGELHVDRFIFKPIPDSTVRATAVKTREIDWAHTLAYEDVLQYRQNPSDDYFFGIDDKALMEVGGITMDVTEPPFDDLRVRQAVAYALDKSAIREGVYKGLGYPTKSYYRSGFWSSPNAYEYPYDSEKAKKLLVEAGYPDGFDTTIHTLSTMEATNDMAVMMQGYLKEVGINATIFAEEEAMWADTEARGDFDMHIAFTIVLPDPDTMYTILAISDAVYPGWHGHYTNPRIDELCIEGRKEQNMDKRKEYYDEVADIMNREVAVIWIGASMQSYGHGSHIDGIGYDIQANFIYDLNQGCPQITKSK